MTIREEDLGGPIMRALRGKDGYAVYKQFREAAEAGEMFAVACKGELAVVSLQYLEFLHKVLRSFEWDVPVDALISPEKYVGAWKHVLDKLRPEIIKSYVRHQNILSAHRTDILNVLYDLERK